MKVSISFATIRGSWLPNTFQALGRQTLPHDQWEFVMVDDWGDRAGEVEALAKENRVNVKYTRSKPWHWKSNRQLGNARNTGFIHSDGELVVFLDDISWFGPRWLELHWELYRRTGAAIIGAVYGTKYHPGPIEKLQVESDDGRIGKGSYNPCNPGWFYTFNASAPLRFVVDVNGYDERYDTAGEDDVDLGLRLSRVGLKFLFSTHPEIHVWHMRHNGGQSRPSPFKPDECDRFTKEMLGAKYDGSWGLMEDNARRQPWEVNEGYFNLASARQYPSIYPHYYKEMMYGR